MDKLYIDNISESPFVTEGLGSYLKDKWSQLTKIGNVGLNNPITTPISSSTQTVTSSVTDSANTLASIMETAMDIIIEEVTKDVINNADDYIVRGHFQPPLPKDWSDDPKPLSTTKTSPPGAVPYRSWANPVAETIGDEDSESGGELEDPEEPSNDYTDQFLYRFHSKYNKFPGSFNIIVGEKLITIAGEQVKVISIWKSVKYKNYIYAQIDFNKGDSPTNKLIFSFYDDEVNPKTRNGKLFSIEKIYNEVHPNKNPFEGVDPKLVSRIKLKTDKLFRAFYATTRRKSKEFKSKERGLLPLSLDPSNGSVSYSRGVGRGRETLDHSEIEQRIHGKKSERWIKSLNAIGYFDHPMNANMKSMVDQITAITPTISASKPSNLEDAILALMKLGKNKTIATDLATKSLDALSKIKVNDPITSGDILNYSLSGNPNVSTDRIKRVSSEPITVPKLIDSPTTPTKPIEKPKKKSKSGKSLGTLTDKGNEIEYISPKTGEIHNFDRNQVQSFIKRSPRFAKAMKNAGLLDKYISKSDSGDYTIERLVNPYQGSNFL